MSAYPKWMLMDDGGSLEPFPFEHETFGRQRSSYPKDTPEQSAAIKKIMDQVATDGAKACAEFMALQAGLRVENNRRAA